MALWSDEEKATMTEMFRDGACAGDVAAALGRTIPAVWTQRRMQATTDNDAFLAAELNQLRDEKFCAAMKAAIAAGLEHAPLGVVGYDPDVRTTARFVSAGSSMSLVGSPSALCAMEE